MGAVAGGSLITALALVVTALGLLRWRQVLLAGEPDELHVDLAAVEAAARQEDLAFDAIVGRLLLADPSFADTAARLAGQDGTDAAS